MLLNAKAKHHAETGETSPIPTSLPSSPIGSPRSAVAALIAAATGPSSAATPITASIAPPAPAAADVSTGTSKTPAKSDVNKAKTTTQATPPGRVPSYMQPTKTRVSREAATKADVERKRLEKEAERAKNEAADAVWLGSLRRYAWIFL